MQLYSHRKILVAALNGPVMGAQFPSILPYFSQICKGIAAGRVSCLELFNIHTYLVYQRSSATLTLSMLFLTHGYPARSHSWVRCFALQN